MAALYKKQGGGLAGGPDSKCGDELGCPSSLLRPVNYGSGILSSMRATKKRERKDRATRRMDKSSNQAENLR
jgi:hypothetical protein